MLTSNDCEAVAIGSQNQALALAKVIAFDLYILDNWLPGISGTHLCTLLREFDSTTPILFYSGAAFDADKEYALSCGAQGYLTKPCSPDELIAEVFRLTSLSAAGCPLTSSPA